MRPSGKHPIVLFAFYDDATDSFHVEFRLDGSIVIQTLCPDAYRVLVRNAEREIRIGHLAFTYRQYHWSEAGPRLRRSVVQYLRSILDQRVK